jgi:hypothetical protein
MSSLRPRRRETRALAAVELVENVIYAVIAIFLIGSGVLLLLGAGIDISKNFDVNNIHPLVVRVLDETLLVFMVVELLHVGLIAGVRRILILTASSDTLHGGPDFVVYWVQLLLLIVLVVAMVVALFIWHRTGTPAE